MSRRGWLTLVWVGFCLFGAGVFSILNAADYTWTQTDWSGGSGQAAWSDSTKFANSTNLATDTAGAFTLTPTAGWYDAGWRYRHQINLDNSGLSATLTDFPLLVKLTSYNFDFTQAQTDGADLRFTASNGTTELSYEIESWDDGNQEAWIWVQIPTIEAPPATPSFYIYYGNSTANDAQSSTAVWDNNYRGVWHFQDNPADTAPQMRNSVTDNKDATANGGMNAASRVTGPIGSALNFNGSGEYLNIPNDTSLQPGDGSWAVEFWAQPANVDQTAALIAKRQAGGDFEQWSVWICGDENCTVSGQRLSGFFLGGGGWRRSALSNTDVADGDWHHYSMIADKAADTVYLYQDGVALAVSNISNDNWPTIDNGDPLRIADSNSGQYFAGPIDEVRISGVSRSADWILATYRSDTDNLNTFAAVEEQIESPGQLTSSIFDTGQNSDWGTLDWTAIEPIHTSVGVKVRSGGSSDLSDATDFSACDNAVNHTDLSANNCVQDGDRYVQYQVNLSNSDGISTPTWQEFKLAYESSDSSPPSITLTPLSPDPSGNATPSWNGTATDAESNISQVQFQLNDTNGSWNDCTAADGNFNSASENFICAPDSALTDGSHTIYVRATDSNGNTSSNTGVSDSLIIDTVAPVAFNLLAPNGYINADRPHFRWRPSSDVHAGLTSYRLRVDNGASGSFTLDNLPIAPAGANPYLTDQYNLGYQNWLDSDADNDYLDLFTQSTAAWGNNQNDGRLVEGRRSWEVTATDQAGWSTTQTGYVSVDRTAPQLSGVRIGGNLVSQETIVLDNRRPTIGGRSTDPLAGDRENTRVASGLSLIQLIIEQRNGANYQSYLQANLNLDQNFWESDGQAVTDFNLNTAAKYAEFSFTPREALPSGEYRLTILSQDRAGNQSRTSWLFRLGAVPVATAVTSSLTQVPQQIKQHLTAKLAPPPPVASASGTRSSSEPSILRNVLTQIIQAQRQLGQKVAQTLTQARTILGWPVVSAARQASLAVSQASRSLAYQISYYTTRASRGLAGLTFALGKQTQNFSDVVGYHIIDLGYLFINEPLAITAVQTEVLSPTSVRITWQTNHPANGQVNYGLDLNYSWSSSSEQRVTNHTFVLTELNPQTTYHFEVMSHQHNYVYDANRQFTTPALPQ